MRVDRYRHDGKGHPPTLPQKPQLIPTMTSPKTTTAAHFVWLAASVLFWPMLIAGSWAFMPLPLAALNSMVHCLGLILTAWPAINHLCGTPLPGSGRDGTGAGGSLLHRDISSAAVSPKHSAEWCDSFPDQDRTRSPRGRVEASRTILPGPGFDFAAGQDGVTRLPNGTGTRVFLSPGGWPHRLDLPTPDDAA